jgi:hypothetical protein
MLYYIWEMNTCLLSAQWKIKITTPWNDKIDSNMYLQEKTFDFMVTVISIYFNPICQMHISFELFHLLCQSLKILFKTINIFYIHYRYQTQIFDILYSNARNDSTHIVVCFERQECYLTSITKRKQILDPWCRFVHIEYTNNPRTSKQWK